MSNRSDADSDDNNVIDLDGVDEEVVSAAATENPNSLANVEQISSDEDNPGPSVSSISCTTPQHVSENEMSNPNSTKKTSSTDNDSEADSEDRNDDELEDGELESDGAAEQPTTTSATLPEQPVMMFYPRGPPPPLIQPFHRPPRLLDVDAQQPKQNQSPPNLRNRPEDIGVCKFYIRGTCTWDDKCKFRHPKGAELEEWKDRLLFGGRKKPNSETGRERNRRSGSKRRSRSNSSARSAGSQRRHRRRSIESDDRRRHRRETRRSDVKESNGDKRRSRSPATRSSAKRTSRKESSPPPADLSSFKIPKRRRKSGSSSRSASPIGFIHKNPTKRQVQDFFTPKEDDKPLAYRRHVNRTPSPVKNKRRRSPSTSSSSSSTSDSSSSSSAISHGRSKRRREAVEPPVSKKPKPDLLLQADKISSDEDIPINNVLRPQQISSDSDSEAEEVRMEPVEISDSESNKSRPREPVLISSEATSDSSSSSDSDSDKLTGSNPFPSAASQNPPSAHLDSRYKRKPSAKTDTSGRANGHEFASVQS